MGLSAHEIRRLADAGASTELLVLVGEIVEARDARDEKRKADQRDRKRRSRSVTRQSQDGHVTGTGQGCDEDAQKASSPPVPPHTPPLTPTPSKMERETREAFAVPEWIPQQEWDDFVLMRERMAGKKSVFTDAAKRGIIRDLDALRAKGHDPGGVLEQSVKRGWRGVFEIKEQGNGNPNVRTYDNKPKPLSKFQIGLAGIAAARAKREQGGTGQG